MDSLAAPDPKKVGLGKLNTKIYLLQECWRHRANEIMPRQIGDVTQTN